MIQSFLYAEIDDVYGIGAAQFTAGLPHPVVDLELHINSAGGNAWDGLSIYSNLKQRSGVTRIVVDGLAASIASVICMAASPGELYMAPAATMVIHPAWTSATGDAADLRAAADQCEFMSRTIARVYSWRTGVPEGTWLDLMDRETFFSSQEAVSAKLADKVLADPAAEFRAGLAAKLADRVLTRAVSASAVRRDSRPRRMG